MEITVLRVTKRVGGGDAYLDLLLRVLKRRHLVHETIWPGVDQKPRRFVTKPRQIVWLARISGSMDLWIRDPLSVAVYPVMKTRGKNLALFYHLDTSVMPTLGLSRVLERLCYRNLPKMDSVVVISQFWAEALRKKGVASPVLIPYGFDLSEFDIGEEEVEQFKRDQGLTAKPIVYLGNCQNAKGVVEAYLSLKDEPYHLVTSGEPRVSLSCRNLFLPRRQYLCLLKASSVTVTMSKFKEGWCLTAHESLLCRTPVVGSGTGGMRELLEGGGQLICRDFHNLPEMVSLVLEKAREMGEAGRKFAEQFTLDKFEAAWCQLLTSLEEYGTEP
jgi:glycosyltransferase involved in cell wall biosynthesis